MKAANLDSATLSPPHVAGALDSGDRLTLRKQTGFGTGDSGFNLYWQAITLYLLYYYTDAGGLPSATAGWIAGFALVDPPPQARIVEDHPRSDDLSRYLCAAHDPYRQGVRWNGLLYGPATGNSEWGEGSARKFGLVHFELDSQACTPKRSPAY